MVSSNCPKPVKIFRYPVGRTAKTCRPAALQPLQSPTVWVFKALNLVNYVFKSKTQRVVEHDKQFVLEPPKRDLGTRSKP